MNIFVLDENPAKAAEYHCKKHVVKMILESTQMLSSAHWLALEKKMKSKADKFIHYFGEGTVWDLDYGKLLILFLCIYIAIQVS